MRGRGTLSPPRHSSRDSESPLSQWHFKAKTAGGPLCNKTAKKEDRRENVAGLICYCHPNLTPLPPP